MEIDFTAVDASSSTLPKTSPAALSSEANLFEDDDDTNDDISSRISTLTSTLHDLSIRAYHQLQSQPLSTQDSLSRSTSAIYSSYAHHGSLPRLSESLRKFLSEETEDGMMVYSPEEIEAREAANPETMIPNPLAVTFEELCAVEPPKDSTDPTSTTSKKPTMYSHSAESTMLVHTTPFNPADLSITWPNHLSLPPTLMSSINNILALHNAFAQARSRHHIAKYLLPSPVHPQGLPHALPLVRLGIAQGVASGLDGIFDTASTDSLGFNPESRGLLREAYQAQTGCVSASEIGWLARVLRVDVEVVRMWWEEEDERRKGEVGLRVWAAAREGERRMWYKEREML
jgi:hypothetical protein